MPPLASRYDSPELGMDAMPRDTVSLVLPVVIAALIVFVPQRAASRAH